MRQWGKERGRECRAANGWRVKSQSAAEVQRDEERRGERHLAAEGRERRGSEREDVKAGHSR